MSSNEGQEKSPFSTSEPLINEKEEEEIKNQTSKKPLIIIIISIIVILITVGILIYFFVIKKNSDDSDNISNDSENKNINSITGKYMIDFPTNLTTIFHFSYLDLIDNLTIDDESVKINNIQTFKDEGYHIITIYFKKELTS